jgi:hypothetical protein
VPSASFVFFARPAFDEVLLPPHEDNMIAKTALKAPIFLTLKLDEPNIVTPHGFSDSALKDGERIQHLALKCG